MQFRLGHLIIATSWVALFFALFRLSPVIAMMLLPATFGPLGGFLAGRSAEACVVGFVSGFFTCLMSSCCGCGSLGFLAQSTGTNLPSGAGVAYLFAVVSLILCSFVGGYLFTRAVAQP